MQVRAPPPFALPCVWRQILMYNTRPAGEPLTRSAAQRFGLGSTAHAHGIRDDAWHKYKMKIRSPQTFACRTQEPMRKSVRTSAAHAASYLRLVRFSQHSSSGPFLPHPQRRRCRAAQWSQRTQRRLGTPSCFEGAGHARHSLHQHRALPSRRVRRGHSPRGASERRQRGLFKPAKTEEWLRDWGMLR